MAVDHRRSITRALEAGMAGDRVQSSGVKPRRRSHHGHRPPCRANVNRRRGFEPIAGRGFRADLSPAARRRRSASAGPSRSPARRCCSMRSIGRGQSNDFPPAVSFLFIVVMLTAGAGHSFVDLLVVQRVLLAFSFRIPFSLDFTLSPSPQRGSVTQLAAISPGTTARLFLYCDYKSPASAGLLVFVSRPGSCKARLLLFQVAVAPYFFIGMIIPASSSPWCSGPWYLVTGG